jgi:hypothetical protein
MQIEYLTKMKNTPKIGSWENRGISEQEIEKLEQKFGIEFPKAYKEFLFLGGEFQNAIDWDTITEYLDWTQENIKESMENINLHINPFFVFANYGNDQCLFFFFGEGENPPIYMQKRNFTKIVMENMYIIKNYSILSVIV